MVTLMPPPEEKVVCGDPSLDTSGVPLLSSQQTERSVSSCMLKVELRWKYPAVGDAGLVLGVSIFLWLYFLRLGMLYPASDQR